MRPSLLLLLGTLAASLACAGRAEPAPQLQVAVSLPGAGPVDVEHLLAMPVEQALWSVPGLSSVRTRSVQGQVTLVLELEPGTDPWQARSQMAEALDQVSSSLPEDAETPLLQVLVEDPPVMEIFSGPDPLQVKQQARDHVGGIPLSPGLLVAIEGEVQPEVRVELSPDRLSALGLHAHAVHEALLQAGSSDPEDLSQLALGPELRLGDVAEIRLDNVSQVQFLHNGEPAVLVRGDSGSPQPVPEVQLFLVSYEGQALWQAVEQVLELAPTSRSLARLEGSMATISLWEVDPEARFRLQELAIPGLRSRLVGAQRWELLMAGTDRELLDDLAPLAARALRNADCGPRVTDLTPPDQPELAVHVHRERAARMGMGVEEISRASALCLHGAQMTTQEGSVHLSFKDCGREHLPQLPLRTPDGQSVPLAQVADIELRAAPAELLRVDGLPARTLFVDAEGSCTTASLASALQDLDLPAGAHVALRELP